MFLYLSSGTMRLPAQRIEALAPWILEDIQSTTRLGRSNEETGTLQGFRLLQLALRDWKIYQRSLNSVATKDVKVVIGLTGFCISNCSCSDGGGSARDSALERKGSALSSTQECILHLFGRLREFLAFLPVWSCL